MSKKLYIGIDNGVSGTIGVVGEKTVFTKIPVKVELDYTKAKANLTRIDYKKLYDLLNDICGEYQNDEIIIAIERPMVNPTRFVATKSALRALESVLICIEALEIPFQFIDSKEWQKKMLPSGIAGEELKRASTMVSNRLFPNFKDIKHPDRDGILIAEYLRKTYEK